MATQLMSYNYWAQALEPLTHTREAAAVRSLLTATREQPPSLQLEKACAHQQRPIRARNKLINLKKCMHWYKEKLYWGI